MFSWLQMFSISEYKRSQFRRPFNVVLGSKEKSDYDKWDNFVS